MTRHSIPALLAACLLAGPAAAQTVPETIEWTWTQQPEKADPALPNVLLVGDSITRGYYPEVVARLAGKANVYDFTTSAASGDPRLPRQLRDFAAWRDVTFAVVHVNNGMHGWAYDEVQYGAGLPGLVDTLKALYPAATLIWASTTPVRAPKPDGANNDRIDARNRLAAQLMAARHIVIDDQHALMRDHDALHSDDVHYTRDGSDLQGDQAAEMIGAVLRK